MRERKEKRGSNIKPGWTTHREEDVKIQLVAEKGKTGIGTLEGPGRKRKKDKTESLEGQQGEHQCMKI